MLKAPTKNAASGLGAGNTPMEVLVTVLDLMGIPAREILVEMGRRGMVGGQEDMIEDTALSLLRQRQAG